MEPLFELGRVVCTRSVSERMEEDKDFEEIIIQSIHRHANGDFGIMPEEDCQYNLKELESGVLENGGGKILSRYHTDGTTYTEPKEGDVYIQTLRENDFVYTCVMFCEED